MTFIPLAEVGSRVESESGEVPGVAAGGGAKRAARPRRDPRPAQKRDTKKSLVKKVNRFRSESILGIVGPNGSGKSLLSVLLLIPTIDGIEWECDQPDHDHCDTIWERDELGNIKYDDQGEKIFLGYGPNAVFKGTRRVLSTVELLDSTTGERAKNYERLREWRQVLDAEHCDIFFDEITGIAGSREAMGMPVDVQNVLNQMRRRDCMLIWTAPSFARADSIIRSCTKLIVQTDGLLKDWRGFRASESAPSAWIPNRLFRWRAFDGDKFDDWNKAKANQDARGVKPLRAAFVLWFWGPGSRPFASYDTWAEVTRVGSVLDGGRCSHCGGRRQVPVCKCEH